MISMPFFWFVLSVSAVLLNFVFRSMLLIGVSVACAVAGIIACIFPVLQLQLAVFIIVSLMILVFYGQLTFNRQSEEERACVLDRVIGKTVTVHYWREGHSEVQLNGRVWPAEFVEFSSTNLKPGKYWVWKIIDGRLILTK
ncbi:MAG: hypothetical protein IJ022_07000 [Burkholderiaceae bacterium]|nr:hypothetical protein [Burkholderiaceae bacterium]